MQLLHKKCNLQKLTAEKWRIVETTVIIIKMFDHVTTEISVEKFVTVYKFLLILKIINSKSSKYTKKKLQGFLNERFKYVDVKPFN